MGLAGSIGDLGHLEVGVDLRGNARKLALGVEQLDEVAQIHDGRADASLRPRP